MQQELATIFDEISQNFIKLKTLTAKIEEVIQVCETALRNGHKLMFCGNGGSAADSQHLAAELVGRYKLNRPAMNAVALTVDTSILTAVANDFGYETIFARQVEGIGKAGDVLIGLSTSGNSKNILLAFAQAKQMNIKTVALTGEHGGMMRSEADLIIDVPAEMTNHIQEMHIAVGHVLCEMLERNLNVQ